MSDESERYEEKERDEMTESAQEEKLEQRWLDGNTAAYRAILLECARNLDAGDPLTKAAALIGERRDAVVALRNLCERFDLSDHWPDSLHLADIIEKYIERGLARKYE